jgi:hypothetical protein
MNKTMTFSSTHFYFAQDQINKDEYLSIDHLYIQTHNCPSLPSYSVHINIFRTSPRHSRTISINNNRKHLLSKLHIVLTDVSIRIHKFVQMNSFLFAMLLFRIVNVI